MALGPSAHKHPLEGGGGGRSTSTSSSTTSAACCWCWRQALQPIQAGPLQELAEPLGGEPAPQLQHHVRPQRRPVLPAQQQVVQVVHKVQAVACLLLLLLLHPRPQAGEDVGRQRPAQQPPQLCRSHYVLGLGQLAHHDQAPAGAEDGPQRRRLPASCPGQQRQGRRRQEGRSTAEARPRAGAMDAAAKAASSSSSSAADAKRAAAQRERRRRLQLGDRGEGLVPRLPPLQPL